MVCSRWFAWHSREYGRTFSFQHLFLPQAWMSGILPFLNRANLAADLCFLLSGFVMAHVYGAGLAWSWQTNWWKFASARFARIYPLSGVSASWFLRYSRITATSRFYCHPAKPRELPWLRA